MAMTNYDEVTHTNLNLDWDTMDPMFRWDTHFPERISRLNITSDFPQSPGRSSRQRRGRNRNAARFKTQPITFDEIKEVDEEGVDESKSKEGLKHQFAAFSRSMDGLVVKPKVVKPKIPAASQPTTILPGSTNTTTTALPVSTKSENNPEEQQKDTSIPSKENQPSTDRVSKTGLIRDGQTIGQLQHDCARARRKKRHHRRSIEEEPEVENTAPVAT